MVTWLKSVGVMGLMGVMRERHFSGFYHSHTSHRSHHQRSLVQEQRTLNNLMQQFFEIWIRATSTFQNFFNGWTIGEADRSPGCVDNELIRQIA